MTKFSVFTDYGALNSKPVFSAFIEGINALGHEYVLNSLDADVAVIWSVLWHGRMSKNRDVYNFFKSQNKPVIIIEVGSIIRGTTWRVGVDGITPNNLIYSTSDNRIKKFNLHLAEWNTRGNHILICCQNDKSQLWNNLPSNSTWVNGIIENLRQFSDMQIQVRPHPRSPFKLDLKKYKNVLLQIPKLNIKTYDSYDLNFKNVWATVSWNSSPGPLSIIAGVPVYCSTDSIAYPVSIQSVSNILNPEKIDRTEWLDKFSKSEFTLDELRTGQSLKKLTFT